VIIWLLLIFRGLGQGYNRCVCQIGATRPFHQEKKLGGRSFYTYVGDYANNCDLQKAELYQYRILNGLKDPRPTVTDQRHDETRSNFDQFYSQKVHDSTKNPQRDALFAVPKASIEEVAAAIWDMKPLPATFFQKDEKRVESKAVEIAEGEASVKPVEPASQAAAPTAVVSLPAVNTVAVDSRPIFKKFFDTYNSGGAYEHVGGMSGSEAQAVEKVELEAHVRPSRRH